MSNNFDDFVSLPESLQQKAIREGELMLGAQLSTATAADQRALTWSGFLITAATGALGGGIALMNSSSPDRSLGGAAILFSIALLRATWLAVQTVKPEEFYFPGNRPNGWLPRNWQCVGSDKRKESQARLEQAWVLDKSICHNRDCAKAKAKTMHLSITTTVWAVVIAALVIATVVTIRATPLIDRIPLLAQEQSRG